MWCFRPQQATLVAGSSTPVRPAVYCRSVEIINTTAGDLTVQTDPNDAGTSFVVVAGYSKTIDTHTRGFDPTAIAFYLTAAAGGTVVLIWS